MFLFLFSVATHTKSAAQITRSKRMATTMVNKCFNYYKKHGEAKTFKAVNNKKGIFVRGATYVFILDLTMLTKAHGANHGLIGKNIGKLKDVDGFHLPKAIVKLAKSKERGWVDYRWTNPKTKKIEIAKKNENIITEVNKLLEDYSNSSSFVVDSALSDPGSAASYLISAESEFLVLNNMLDKWVLDLKKESKSSYNNSISVFNQTLFAFIIISIIALILSVLGSLFLYRLIVKPIKKNILHNERYL